MQKSNNVRLLLKDHENFVRAVPMNDDLQVSSGIQGTSLPHQLNQAKNNVDHVEVTTIDSGNGRFYVGKRMVEIFQMVAQAEREGAPFVNLTAESGQQAIVNLAAQRKRSYAA